MRYPTVDHEQRLTIVRDIAAQGASTPAIADAIGVSRKTLRYWLDRYAPDLADEITRRHTCLDDIRHLAAMGYNVDGIAQRLGIKPDSIKRRLQRRGEWDLLDSIRTNHQPGREPYRRKAAA